ncbi:hypothetical protein CTRI78_v001041 [Colletotrichum trifolii]|uniref:Uncharacterized protein n=1 Tax=Colletotrichum trifolii TaxID=5466 RepID=A0A4R8RTS6_COLTR|nr:hypothetical protein CTRI78_v001041 [Colletotrichum trifolii]
MPSCEVDSSFESLQKSKESSEHYTAWYNDRKTTFPSSLRVQKNPGYKLKNGVPAICPAVHDSPEKVTVSKLRT